MLFSRLYYISQGKTSAEQLENIQKVLAAGCKLIQLRYKNKTELTALAIQAKNWCMAHDALLIINDFVNVAKFVDADGVHLGLGDTSIQAARTLLGEKKIIGGTANTAQEVLQHAKSGCNYIGLGPFAYTSTKEKLRPILGLAGYQHILQHLKNYALPPIYAVGGISANDIEALRKLGLYGVAVSGLLTMEPELVPLIELKLG